MQKSTHNKIGILKEFKSKIGLELAIPLVIVFAIALSGTIYERVWEGLIIIIVTIALIAHLFANTYYVVTPSELRIKCGIFCQKIEINKIRKISETKNIISSPALSLDRLEIMYNKFDTVLISPRDKTGFVTAITEMKPSIEIIWKKK